MTESWVPVTAERYDNGVGWRPVVAERWDGSSWSPLAMERYGGAPPPAAAYTSPEGDVIAPAGWGRTSWWPYTTGASASTRRALVVYGDSTSFGSGPGFPGNYSWTQRLRKRAVQAGYADGGKGIFAGLEQELTYDSPEVNGIPGAVTYGQPGDGFDTLVGAWLRSVTQGEVHTSQFREDNLRLWYTKRADAAEVITVLIKVGSTEVAAFTITDAKVNGTPQPVFRWVPNLPAGLKTMTVTNTSGGQVRMAIDGVNNTGLQVQKQAMSGLTFGGVFYGQLSGGADYQAPHDGFRFQAPLGLLPNVTIAGPTYAGMTVDTRYPQAARVNPCLALTALGFNDLTNNNTDGTTTAYWTEYVRRFAAACRAAGVDGIVATTQLPYNANWYTHGVDRFNALRAEAAAQGLAFVDMFYPVGGPSLAYMGGTSNPHLNRAQYEAQADRLWDAFLAPTSPAAMALAA